MVKDASELLEPLEEQAASAAPSRTATKGAGTKKSKAGANGGPTRQSASPAAGAPQRSSDIKVQMSHEWIRANIGKAVGTGIAIDLLKKLPGDSRNYNRHLFYSPAYHPSGSPAQHMRAKIQNLPAEQHADHAAFHYGESEIRHAVNKRKAALRNTHGNLPGLEAES